MIGSVEAFDVAYDPPAFLVRDLFAIEILGEGQVRACEMLKFFQGFENFVHLVPAIVQFAIFKANLRAIALVCLQSCFLDESPKLRRAAMDELGP